MTMREENPHAGGKWETMNLLGVALNSLITMLVEFIAKLS